MLHCLRFNEKRGFSRNTIGFGNRGSGDFGDFHRQKGVSRRRRSAKQQATSPAITGEKTEKQHTVTLTSPNDGLVTATEKITLSGTTTPGATVAISGGETDAVVVSDDKGQFSAEIILVGGDNEIRIISFEPKGEKAETVLTVVYSTAEF